MILTLAVFFLLLLILYLTTNRLVHYLYHGFFRLTGKQSPAIEILSFFLLPGTVIHELSHMLVAEILFVKTGKFSFKPEISEGNQVNIGQLAVTATDPFRRTLIGLAPLIAGLSIISLGFQLTIKQFNHETINHLTLYHFLIFLALAYLTLVISTAMFSSRKDLETVIVPAVLLLILVLFFTLAGFKLTVPKNVLDFLNHLFAGLNLSLVWVEVVDLIMLLLFKAINSLFRGR